MSVNTKPAIANIVPPFVKARLADFLTLSRGVLGLVILSLSFIGADAYKTVLALAFIGVMSDIFDGIAARRYLKNGQGKLGKYDLFIDTLFVLCILGYLSFSEIVIPQVLGLGWITLAFITIALYKGKAKILYLFEIPSILALIALAGIYDLGIFALVILPAICAATILNRRRILYLIFKYIPNAFRE
jgi:phosphatidylglycerophosphate synthase